MISRSATFLLLLFPLGALQAQPAQEPLFLRGLPVEAHRDRFVRLWEPVKLAESIVHSPRLIARGEQTAAAWVEPTTDGDDKVYWLTLTDSRLQDASLENLINPVAPTFGTNQSSPALAIHPLTKRPAAAFIADSETGQSFVVAEKDATASVVYATEGILEFPSLDYDGSGNLFAAWAVQVGGRSEAWIAWKPAAGEWSSRRLSDATRPYELLPQIFGSARGGEVYWYRIEGSDISLAIAGLGANGPFQLELPAVEDVPVYRLPILYRPQGAPAPGALWLEPLDGGEAYFSIDPRSGSYPNPEIVGIIGRPPALAAVSSDQFSAKAWVSRPEVGPTTIHAENPFGEAIVQTVSPFVTDPQIAVSSGYVQLLWLAQDADAGLASLYFMRAR